jgi:hypothetical protein
MKGVRERKGGGGARRGLAPGVRMVIRRRREHGVQWLPRRLKMVRNRERGYVGSWRTDQLFVKELGKSGVLIMRKKRHGRQRWCKKGKSHGRTLCSGIME